MSEQKREIAIVGIAADLPGGPSNGNLDYKSFFRFLLDGGEAYEPIPNDRFNPQFIVGDTPGRVLVNSGTFLKNLDRFDYLEFGITAKDAHMMPPSTRKLVELSFLALQDAGVEYRGRNVGCYMSGVAHDLLMVSGHDDLEAKGAFSYAPASVANRVSYHLDLRGPSVPVDTACSSSLYATHLAMQGLRSGDCDQALVGGCQINYRFAEWLIYTQGGILSPDGKCKPFDASANGFSRGEGAVVIVLKPLQDALRDNDHVYGVILGTGVNSSGSLAPVNAPVASAQMDAMERAFAQIDRAPKDVDFLELHATGTAQGDPTEANWVGERFQRDGELVIGSLKGNIGHLEIASFLASLCKVCGIFETGLIPPNVNFLRPNSAIGWSKYGLRVPLKAEPLKVRSITSRALIAMTSSGIGGANGHAVVEGPPSHSVPASFWTEEAEVPVLLIAGGLSPRSSTAIGEELLITAGTSARIAAVARIFGRRARSMTWRSFGIVVSSKSPRFGKPVLVAKIRPPIVFVFSGQGTQHFQMGKELFEACAPFRESVLELDNVYASITGHSLIESTGLFSGRSGAEDPLGDPWPISITLPALTVLQLALVDTLAVVGVSPDVVVGHSAGETAVLSASGAASKSAAIELSIARGRALSLVEDAEGTMAAVSCSPEEARGIIDEVNTELGPGVLCIGCYNTPSAVTLSGSKFHIDSFVAKASAAGIFARKLKTRVPVHSQIMELCRTEYETLVTDTFTRHHISAPTVAVYSTVTGQLLDRPFDPAYYWDGTLGPVRFQEAVQALLTKNASATFVEIGPHPVLASYLQAMSDGQERITITCPLRRPRRTDPGNETVEFVTALGKLVTAGHNIDFDALYGSAGSYTGPLPQYPFMPKPVPCFLTSPESARQRQRRRGPMNYSQLQINVQTHPGLADHVIKDEPIMPAAGYIEMALEFGAQELYNVEFHSMLSLSPSRPVPVQIELVGTHWTIKSSSSHDVSAASQYNRRHATGYLTMEHTHDVTSSPLEVESLRRSMTAVPIEEFYSGMAYFAQYGPLYQRVQQCHFAVRTGGIFEALVELRACDDDLKNLADYRFHPAILDAAVHVAVHPMMTSNYNHDFYYLPSKISAFRLCAASTNEPISKLMYSKVTAVSWSPDALSYDVLIVNDTGNPICAIEGLEVTRHGHRVDKLHQRFEVQEIPISLSLPRFPTQPSPQHFHHSEEDHTSPSYSGNSAKLVLHYVRGEEITIQRHLNSLDPLRSFTLLFMAEEGVSGNAARGFTRALRKEYTQWNVKLAIFHSSWTPSQSGSVAHELLSLVADEPEMTINADGAIQVPRIQLANPPSMHLPFDPSIPWVLRDGQLSHVDIPFAPSDYLTVHISAVAPNGPDVWTFVGVPLGGGLSREVVGIYTGPVCSHLVVHASCVHELAAGRSFLAPDLLGPSLVAPVIIAMLVGPSAFSHPRRLSRKHLLIVSDDDRLVRQIQEVSSWLGMDVHCISSLTNKSLVPVYRRRPDFIVSGNCDAHAAAILRSLLAPSGRLLLWNDPTTGIQSWLRSDPWGYGDVLQSVLEQVVTRSSSLVIFTPPAHAIPSDLHLATRRATGLFDSQKSYLLIGGVGSLGLHIALWMYENGARNLILTSRSGPEGLRRKRDFVAQRMLAYLQCRSDLHLDAVAIDATSQEAMQSLVQNTMILPFGGVMLLTAVLNDRMFALHTQESFEKAFPAKIAAFHVLEHILDIPRLDFVLAFSSISGTFGNPGQTNYAASNTALSGMVQRYKNAVCIVAPAILDSHIVVSADSSYLRLIRHMLVWGHTAQDLCECIEVSLHKLRDGPVGEYIPNFDWRAVRDNMGSSPLFDHLVPLEDANGVSLSSLCAPLSILQAVCDILDMDLNDVSPEVPLTSYGLDSLSAAALSFSLRPLLSVSQIQLLSDVTIRDIEARLTSSSSDASSNVTSQSPEPLSPAENLRTLLATFSSDIPFCPMQGGGQPVPGVVLVTGTTGSVGAHVLANLLQDNHHSTVYALVQSHHNASESPLQRQISTFRVYDLDVSLLSSKKFMVIGCNFEKDFLGIPEETYNQICSSLTHIFHMGWPTDFTSPVKVFYAALEGLGNLLRLASQSKAAALVTFIFASSCGVFRSYSEPTLPPEHPIEAEVAVGQGYSESKWVAEKMLEVAAERNVLRAVVVRIGQLSGGHNGAWKSTQWLPMMVASSARLGILPTFPGVASWLPVSVAADAVVEMANLGATPYSIFHVRHPQPILFSVVIEWFARILNIPVVPYAEWLSALDRALAQSDRHNIRHFSPILGVVSFFRSAGDMGTVRPAYENGGLTVLLGIEESCRLSLRLSAAGSVQLTEADARRWVEFWMKESDALTSTETS